MLTLSESTSCNCPDRVGDLVVSCSSAVGTVTTAPSSSTAKSKRRIGSLPGNRCRRVCHSLWQVHSTGRRLGNDGHAGAPINAMASSLRGACSMRASSSNLPTPSTRTSPRRAHGRTTTRRRVAAVASSATTSTGSESTAIGRSALHGPLPALARTLLGETPRFFHEHTSGERARHPRGHPVAPRRAVLLHRRCRQRQPVGTARPGAARGRCRVHRRLAPVGSPVRAAQVRRPVGLHRSMPTTSSWSPTSSPVRDQHEIVSFDMEPGDVIAFHYRTVHSAPGTAGRTTARRRAVSFRYLGSDARFATRPWLHSPPYDPIDSGRAARRRTVPLGACLTTTGPADARRAPL